jgi:hypothetical protein
LFGVVFGSLGELPPQAARVMQKIATSDFSMKCMALLRRA